MTDQLNKPNVIIGKLFRVKNNKKPKFSNAKDEYFSVWIENLDDTDKKLLLFTKRELDLSEERSRKNF